MLTDDLLKVRYAAHLDKLIELSEKEIERTRPEPHYQRLAQMYHDRFRSLRHTWRCHDGDLVRAFQRLQEAGRVEVITSTATHAFFPLMDRNWANIRAQVHVAADLYERHFGHRPRGMWLGECGYVPGVDELLREAAIRYFFVDTHGDPVRRPAPGRTASTRPIYCPSGVAAFGRDMESSEQVWSAQGGLPRRQALPRLLPRHRLRPADGLHRPVHPPGGSPHVHRHQVPRDHPRPAARQVGLRSGHRARQGRPARLALPRQPREAGAPAARQDGSPADHRQPLRRRALRPLVVRGADLPRRPVPAAALRPERHRDAHAGRLPRPPLHQPGRDAVRVVVGRQGLQRVLAQRDQRLDVPPPARRGRADGRSWRGGTRAPTR